MNVAHVQQPTDSSCIPAVLAMVLGRDVQQVVADLKPSKSGVRHSKMILYLLGAGVKVADRLTVVRSIDSLPERCIVRIRWGKRRWGHVALRNGAWWHDPALPQAFHAAKPDLSWGDGRITSFLELP